MPSSADPNPTIGELGEDPLVAEVIARYPTADWLLVGPGDDAAILDFAGRYPGKLVFCTDTLVEGQDFRREWSTARDVGVKAAAQNFADIAAMGGRPHALLVSLTTPADVPAAWARGLADGLAEECARAGAVVAGGDLSAGAELVVTGTALGTLASANAVLRSGARVGDVVTVAGVCGRSAAGWALLRAGYGRLSAGEESHDRLSDGVPSGDGLPGGDLLAGELSGGEPSGEQPVDDELTGAQLAVVTALIDDHRRPQPPYSAGPQAALAGATAMIDTSDGLLRDAERLAAASGVVLALTSAALQPGADLLLAATILAEPDPFGWVLTGGEDHALLACFPPSATLPPAFRPIGTVHPRPDPTRQPPPPPHQPNTRPLATGHPSDPAQLVDPGLVLVDGRAPVGPTGWHHFA